MIWNRFPYGIHFDGFRFIKSLLAVMFEFCFAFCCLALLFCCFIASPCLHDRIAACRCNCRMRDWGVPNKHISQTVDFCPDCPDCAIGSDWQLTSICSDNGLVPNRRQATMWTNDGLFHRCMYASLGFNELIEANHIHSYHNQYFIQSRHVWKCRWKC